MNVSYAYICMHIYTDSDTVSEDLDVATTVTESMSVAQTSGNPLAKRMRQKGSNKPSCPILRDLILNKAGKPA